MSATRVAVADPEISTGRPPLDPLRRTLLVGAAWLLLYAFGPGIASPGGSPWPVPVALALWAHGASRPGRLAFSVESVLACAAWCGVCSWAAKVHWTSLLFIGPGFGLYYASAGALLRRLGRCLPLALAAPAAWMAVEALRTLLEPPFGLSWMRLGIHVHEVPWLAGSARVWGVWGLSFALAALGGLLADLGGHGFSGRSTPRGGWKLALAAGLGPVAAAVVLSLATSAPATERGPRGMLVQPAIPQERKMRQQTASELFLSGFHLTRDGLAEAAQAGEAPVDFVAWGESMLPIPILDPGLPAAVAAGARSPDWSPEDWAPETLEAAKDAEHDYIQCGLVNADPKRPGLLPRGTAFLSGALVYLARDGAIRRQGGVAVWGADGTRAGTVGKLHLVPGAETMLGLERFGFVRSTIHQLAGYVPDLVAHEGSRRLAFTTRAGREVVFGASVCFDNSYDGTFVLPLAEGPVDFHLVSSNEAWFRGDQEQDQMMAFSHLAAIASGRAIVRATNSGITAVVGPDGRDVARLRVGGRDREVAGTLRADVPVPTATERSRTTFYARSWRFWPLALLLWPWVLLAVARTLGPRRSPAGTQGRG